MVEAILVDTHDGLAAGVDAGLGAGGSLLDTHLGQAGLDGLGHATELLDLLDVLPCAVGDLIGERLHIVRAGPGIDLLGNHGLLLDVYLGIAGDARREVGGQRDGLVEGVGVQTLGMAQGGAHSLDAGTADIVEGVLLGERPAGGLRVGAQGQRLGILGVELLHNLGPQHTGGAHLGYLHEEIHADGPEERQSRRKCVDIHAGVDACAQILQAVGQGVCQLDVAGGAGLLHVVARDGDGVELGHILRGVLEDVGDDTHREFRRVDVGVAHHKLLEDVILYGTGHLLELGALLQTGVDVECQHGQHGAVHGHRHRHLVEWYAVEEHFHVFYRADRHTGLAHIAHHTGVVGVVAAVCSQVKGHGQTFLTGGEIAAVESVGLRSGGESGILADSPGAQGIHGRVRATQEGRQTRHVVEVFESLQVILCIYGFYFDELGSGPESVVGRSHRGVLSAECIFGNVNG